MPKGRYERRHNLLDDFHSIMRHRQRLYNDEIKKIAEEFNCDWAKARQIRMERRKKERLDNVKRMLKEAKKEEKR